VKIFALIAALTACSTISYAQTVCIDPGHPSETSAGANAHGLSENTLNWQVALEMKPLLEAKGYKVVLTKTSLKQKVTNKQRAEIANRAGAKIFVRLHCDIGSGSGYACYYPDRQGRKGNYVGPPANVIRESKIAATTINDTMKPILKPYLRSNPVKTDASTFVGGKQGGVLTGSIYSKVPTALIEMCFINQKRDAQFIASKDGRQKMAQAITTGIDAYLRR
jgi:N-acetylmuramoyl-L-alanine amidase